MAVNLFTTVDAVDTEEKTCWFPRVRRVLNGDELLCS